jgi:calcineurin-like phosphoesterase family protein
MKGQKVLIRGNHDEGPIQAYSAYFTNVYGLYKRYGLWMSHAPIHPDELRGKPNIHGHVHQKSVPDPRYFNACVEPLNGIPISLEEVRKEFIDRGVLDNSNKL